MIKWYVFSKHSKFSYKRANISFEPISSTNFTEKLLKCSTVLTAAGFATTSEALFLGKKLIVIPMKNQFEQTFNAFHLNKMGVKVIKSIIHPNAHYEIVKHIFSGNKIKIEYPENIEDISNKLIELSYKSKSLKNNGTQNNIAKLKEYISEIKLNNVAGRQVSI